MIKLLENQQNTVDQVSRKNAWKMFQQALYTNLYEIPLYTRVNNYVVNSKVKNFKSNPTSDGNFWNIVEVYLEPTK